jgi:hypothetical protein
LSIGCYGKTKSTLMTLPVVVLENLWVWGESACGTVHRLVTSLLTPPSTDGHITLRPRCVFLMVEVPVVSERDQSSRGYVAAPLGVTRRLNC